MITLIYGLIVNVSVTSFRVMWWLLRCIWIILRSILEVFLWAGYFLLFHVNKY